MSENFPKAEAPKEASVNVLRYIAEDLPVPEFSTFEDLEKFIDDYQLVQVMSLAVDLHGVKSAPHAYEKTLHGQETAQDHITRPFHTTVHNRINESGERVPYLFHAYATGGEFHRTTQSMMLPLNPDGSLNSDKFSRKVINWHIHTKGTVKLSYYINNIKKISGLMADAIESMP